MAKRNICHGSLANVASEPKCLCLAIRLERGVLVIHEAGAGSARKGLA